MRNKLIVIKIGTKVLVSELGKIRLSILRSLADQIAQLHARGYCPIIVTSGAIACGNGVATTRTITGQQVAAMVGQPELMAHWREAFNQHGLIIGQGLGTHRDFKHHETVAALRQALKLRIIPILNEIDLVSTEEIRALKLQGDNDAWAPSVAMKSKASRLIILSYVYGLYSANPKIEAGLQLIPEVKVINQAVMALVRRADSDQKSGMESKLKAAKQATSSGITVHLASGNAPQVIIRILSESSPPGTTFLPRSKRRKIKPITTP